MEWRNARQRLERIRELLEELKLSSGQGAVMVVEGRRDEEALRSLGVEGDYVWLSGSGLSMPSVAEEVHSRAEEAVMMLDWDPHGGALENRFAEHLVGFCVDMDRETRRRLGALVRKDVTQVEALPTLVRRLEAEQNVYSF